jgi:hypothetical protein
LSVIIEQGAQGSLTPTVRVICDITRTVGAHLERPHPEASDDDVSGKSEPNSWSSDSFHTL